MKIISLDVSIGNSSKEFYGIIFKNGGVDKFLLANDYSDDELKLLVVSEYETLVTTKIITDIRGVGVVLRDVLEPYRVINKENYRNFLYKAKEEIVLLALKSDLDVHQRIEFCKLVKEINNLDIEINASGKGRLVKKDESIGVSRAICYLQYIDEMNNPTNQLIL